MTEPTDLRDRVEQALRGTPGYFVNEGRMADAVMAVVGPELDRLRERGDVLSEMLRAMARRTAVARVAHDDLAVGYKGLLETLDRFEAERDEARAELAAAEEAFDSLTKRDQAQVRCVMAERDRLRAARAEQAEILTWGRLHPNGEVESFGSREEAEDVVRPGTQLVCRPVSAWRLAVPAERMPTVPELIEMLRRDLETEADAVDPENPPVPARRSGYFSGFERCIALLEEAVPAEDTPEPRWEPEPGGNHGPTMADLLSARAAPAETPEPTPEPPWMPEQDGRVRLKNVALPAGTVIGVRSLRDGEWHIRWDDGATSWERTADLAPLPAPAPTAEAEPAAWVPKVNDRVQHPGEDGYLDGVVIAVSKQHPEALVWDEETADTSRWVMFEDMRPAEAPARPDLTGLAMEEDTVPSEGPPEAEPQDCPDNCETNGRHSWKAHSPRAPRVFRAGDDEPEDRPTLRDSSPGAGFTWTTPMLRNGMWGNEMGQWVRWEKLLEQYGDLTEEDERDGDTASELARAPRVFRAGDRVIGSVCGPATVVTWEEFSERYQNQLDFGPSRVPLRCDNEEYGYVHSDAAYLRLENPALTEVIGEAPSAGSSVSEEA